MASQVQPRLPARYSARPDGLLKFRIAGWLGRGGIGENSFNDAWRPDPELPGLEPGQIDARFLARHPDPELLGLSRRADSVPRNQEGWRQGRLHRLVEAMHRPCSQATLRPGDRRRIRV